MRLNTKHFAITETAWDDNAREKQPRQLFYNIFALQALCLSNRTNCCGNKLMTKAHTNMYFGSIFLFRVTCCRQHLCHYNLKRTTEDPCPSNDYELVKASMVHMYMSIRISRFLYEFYFQYLLLLCCFWFYNNINECVYSWTLRQTSCMQRSTMLTRTTQIRSLICAQLQILLEGRMTCVANTQIVHWKSAQLNCVYLPIAFCVCVRVCVRARVCVYE